MTAPAGHRCGEKRGSYPDRGAALRAMRAFCAQTGAYLPRMNVYPCRGHFHYGRRPGFRNSFGRRAA